MNCQLIGYQHSEGVDKETGKVYKSCSLFFVRKPTLSENGVEGNVAFSTKVYDDNISKLPKLAIGSAYNVDCRQYKGKYYIDDMTALS